MFGQIAPKLWLLVLMIRLWTQDWWVNNKHHIVLQAQRHRTS